MQKYGTVEKIQEVKTSSELKACKCNGDCKCQQAKK